MEITIHGLGFKFRGSGRWGLVYLDDLLAY